MQGVLRHLGAVHAFDPNLSITCGIAGCPRIYSNFHSYKKHIYRSHSEVVIPPETSEEISAVHSHNEDASDDYNAPSEQGSLQSILPQTGSTFSKRAIALILLKLKQERKISQTALNEILKDFIYLYQTTAENLKEMVIQAVQMDPSPSTLIPKGLHSQHLQQSYFKSFLGYLVNFV